MNPFALSACYVYLALGAFFARMAYSVAEEAPGPTSMVERVIFSLLVGLGWPVVLVAGLLHQDRP